jgi:hypothetical protein
MKQQRENFHREKKGGALKIWFFSVVAITVIGVKNTALFCHRHYTQHVASPPLATN